MSRLAVDLAQQAGQRERAAMSEAAAAVWEGFFGNAAAARRSAIDALELARGRDVEYAAALLSLDAREPAAALLLLQASARFDLAVPSVAFNGFFGALYSVYVRGEADLTAQQPAEAATEFQKILDHRGIVLGDPMDAMARLQLGRALARSGDTVKAKSVYEDFLNL